MKQFEDNHLESAKRDFASLKENKEIPLQMETKLSYLLSKIEGRPTSQSLMAELPEYQLHSLDQLDKETGTHLFCNIVNCLSGKQIVLYFRDEKGYIRKDEILSSWKVCYITCDSESVLIRKKAGEKITYRFSIQQLRVSKTYKCYKKKFVFGVCYEQKKRYLIGFELESVCSRVHELLRGIIKEKIRKALSLEKSKVQQTSTFSEMSVSKIQEKMEKTVVSDQSQQQIQQQEEQINEESDKGVVIQYIKQIEVSGNSLYRLLKTTPNDVRILVHKNYPNRLRYEFLSQKPKKTCDIFSFYLAMDEWNPQIERVQVKTKVDSNSYVMAIRVKKYSYMSWARSTIVLATALTYQNKYYLVIRSTGEDSEDTDTVKMQWNQIIEICEDTNKEKVLITISTDFDFKGYSSLEDSQAMTLKALDINQFQKYLQARLIDGKCSLLFNLTSATKKVKKIKVNKQSSPLKSSYFQSENSQTQSKKKERDRKLSTGSQFSIPDQLPNLDDSQIIKSEKDEEGLQFENSCLTDDFENFRSYMLKDKQSQINPKLIELVKKNVFERYYLKEHFDQSVHLDIHKNEHSVVQPNHYVFQNQSWKLNDSQDLVFINQKEIDIQKDIIKMIIKQLGSNIMSGKSIMNMSLPVEIFDSRSMLERIAMGFGFAPKYLVPASKCTDVIEQTKLMTLFGMSICSLHLALAKPFNPILGETFQCQIGGIPFYLQQISHHPPISAIYMQMEGIKFYGAYNIHGDMGLNRFTGRNLSTMLVEFSNTNTIYEMKLSDVEISGLLHGQRKAKANGVGFIHERNNNVFVEWNIGKDKKKIYPSDKKIKDVDVFGGIFKVTEAFSKKFQQCENKQKFDGLKVQDIVQTLVKINGHWCLDIFFNGQKAKSIDNPIPNKIQYPKVCLPSDSNFRLDLLYKRLGDNQLSNEYKQIMQNIQRRDKKLREGKIKI